MPRKKDAKFHRPRFQGKRLHGNSRMDKKTIRIIRNVLRRGNYLETAFALADVPKRTGYEWIMQGRKDEEAGKDTLCSRFLHMVEKAEQEATARGIDVIEAHARRNWQAMAWRIERRQQRQWGNKSQLSIEGSDGPPIRTEVSIQYVDDWRKVGGEDDEED